MKSLYESLLDDFDNIESSSKSDIITSIKTFITKNFHKNTKYRISRKPNSDGFYEITVSKDLELNPNLKTSDWKFTNDLFIWKEVKGDVHVNGYLLHGCSEIDLEGAPKKVGGNFFCYNCKNLTSLKGAPKEIGGHFTCYFCSNLTSLEGAPEKVGGAFNCSNCSNLTSLKGAPEKVGAFNCSQCHNLKSLKGAPKEVGGDFDCSNCDNLVTLEGGPEKVGGDFICAQCYNLKFLKDAPKEVGGDFMLHYCRFDIETNKNTIGHVGGRIIWTSPRKIDDVRQLCKYDIDPSKITIYTL